MSWISLVVYVDDLKLAGPKNNLAKGWAGVRSVVDLGKPEPYDRYFGCMRVEKNGVKLPVLHTSFKESVPRGLCW